MTLPVDAPPELLTPTEMAEADRLTIAGGVPGIALMERAGAAVAEEAVRRWRGGVIVVLCGPGNNGGDGWVAARILRDRGYRVRVGYLGDRGRLNGDAALAATGFAGEAGPAKPGHLQDAGLVVDALFGAGLRLPLSEEAGELVKAANLSGAPIVAVDTPTGVDGETGAIGEAAIRAAVTVTFFRLKPAHLLLPGRDLCGETVLADIGIQSRTLLQIGPRARINIPALWLNALPRPRAGGHKYDRGHALVLSGPSHSTGAARLAALAALRIGSGLVTLASPPSAVLVNASHLTAVMLRSIADIDALSGLLSDRRLNTVVLGPGLGIGEGTCRRVEAAIGPSRQVVIDADAITSFADDPHRLFKAIAEGRGVVLTPHDGEFARLFPGITGSRLDRARRAAALSGAVILLKGADTVVARPDGFAAICANAPSWLATAGSGDVLAGLIGGLMAQGMDAFDAACAGAWIHGEAGREYGTGLIAEDLPCAAGQVLGRLLA